jgi:NAD(P)-dependent dehydrogenase (short-subunit alcohol dehydrogenase family)
MQFAAGSTPLADRVFLITGATDGIGKYTAELLAQQKCTILVHGRDAAKVAAVVDALAKDSPGKVHGFVADLSLLSETRRFAEEVRERFPKIHGLLNNAGTFDGDYSGKRVVTAEGNEYTLAVNVLAPFLLTSILLNNVRSSGAGRVLMTSSFSAGSADALSDLQSTEQWSAQRAYELSKLCDAMILQEMNARFAQPPQLTFHSFDPGTVSTKMWRPESTGNRSTINAPVEGATASFWMLLDDYYQEVSGFGKTLTCGQSADARSKLWDELTEMTGASFPAKPASLPPALALASLALALKQAKDGKKT